MCWISLLGQLDCCGQRGLSNTHDIYERGQEQEHEGLVLCASWWLGDRNVLCGRALTTTTPMGGVNSWQSTFVDCLVNGRDSKTKTRKKPKCIYPLLMMDEFGRCPLSLSLLFIGQRSHETYASSSQSEDEHRLWVKWDVPDWTAFSLLVEPLVCVSSVWQKEKTRTSAKPAPLQCFWPKIGIFQIQEVHTILFTHGAGSFAR